jgi:SagB-type dehydrogenase family enzyme
MRTDRRSFFRLLAGAAALLSGKISAARPTPEHFDIHEATRNTRLGALGVRRPRLSGPPPDHKDYPGKRRVVLPTPIDAPARTLAEIVRQWEPVEAFAGAAISLAQLGRLLYFSNGITLNAPAGANGPARRAAPSAGALYSGEVYVAAARVQGLPPGVYYYEVAEHRLVEVSVGLESAALADAIGWPVSIGAPAATILLTNVFGRYSWRYANRGYRYALIDSGHIGENLRLAAASAGLAQRDSLAFHDDLLNELLAIDGTEEAVCSVHAVGLLEPAHGAKARPARAGTDTPRVWVEAQRALGFVARGPITARYHAATKLVPGSDAEARFEMPKAFAPPNRVFRCPRARRVPR